MRVLPEPPVEVLGLISDPNMRRVVVEFFELAQREIDDSGVDLVVLTARRLPCLYQSLVASGMVELRGALIVTDRALDAMSPWIWRNVLILDDTVILGSTLARLYDRISAKPGVERVSSRCIAVDRKNASPYLLSRARVTWAAELSPVEIERFSEDIVRTLFSSGVPFFSDFPVTVPFTFERTEWISQLSSPAWRVADVTAPLLEGLGRSALVLLPTDQVRSQLLGGLPEATARMIEHVKLRAYIASPATETGGAEPVEVRFVPICLAKPATREELSTAIAQFLEALEIDSSRSPLPSSPEALHVELQYLVALYCMHRALDVVTADAIPRKEEGVFDQVALSMAHGPRFAWMRQVLEQIVKLARRRNAPSRAITMAIEQPRPYALLAKPALQRLLWEQQELMATIGVPPEPKAGEVTKVGLAFAHAVSSIFGFIGETYERPERRRLAKQVSERTYDELIGHSRARLIGDGFTLDELGSLLTLTNLGSGWGEASLTLALDIGNDLGITVPITRFDEVRGLAYRCFRLGETASLAAVPMGRAQWAKKGFDSLTRSVYSGYPLFSYSATIEEHAEAIGGATRENPQTKVLRRFIRRALPGLSTARLFGTVVAVTDGRSFVARVRESNGSDAGLVEFDWGILVEPMAHQIAENSEIVWTRFARIEDANRLVSSRVRVVGEPPGDSASSDAVASELARVLGDG